MQKRKSRPFFPSLPPFTITFHEGPSVMPEKAKPKRDEMPKVNDMLTDSAA